MSCYRAIKNVDSEYDCPTFLKITIVKHSGSATSLSKPNTFYYLCLRVLIHPILLIIFSTNCYTSHLKPQFYFTNSDTFLLTSLILTDFNNPYLKSILQYTNVNTSLIKSMSPSHQTSLPHITHFNTSLLNSMFSVPSSSLSPTKSLHYTNLARANGH